MVRNNIFIAIDITTGFNGLIEKITGGII